MVVIGAQGAAKRSPCDNVGSDRSQTRIERDEFYPGNGVPRGYQKKPPRLRGQVEALHCLGWFVHWRCAKSEGRTERAHRLNASAQRKCPRSEAKLLKRAPGLLIGCLSLRFRLGLSYLAIAKDTSFYFPDLTSVLVTGRRGDALPPGLQYSHESLCP